MSRPLLKASTTRSKTNKSVVSLDTYQDRIWRKYESELRQNINRLDMGKSFTKKDFKMATKAYYQELTEDNPSLTHRQKLTMAVNKYQRSLFYTPEVDKYIEWTSQDLQEQTGLSKKQFKLVTGISMSQYNSDGMTYLGTGTTRDGIDENGYPKERVFSAYKYGNGYIVRLNSPTQIIVLTEDEFKNSVYSVYNA